MGIRGIDVVRAVYEAFGAGDIPRVLALFDEQIVWTEADNFPYADGNPYVGPQAVLEGVFARCGSEWDGFAVQVDEMIDAEDVVLVLGRYLGTYKATGKEQSTQLAHVWWVKEDKIVRFQQYADTLGIARVIGATT